MKTRTRILAGLFLGYSALAFVGLIGTIVHFGGPPRMPSGIAWGLLGSLIFWGLQWPLWWALLRSRSWAWWSLAIMLAGYVALVVSSRTYYLLARPKPSLADDLVGAGIVVIYGTALWLLLSDKPSNWHRSATQP